MSAPSRAGIDSKQAGKLLPQSIGSLSTTFWSVTASRCPPTKTGGRPATLNISPKGYEPLLDVVFAHRIRLFASALGSPPAEVVTRAHDNGVLVAALAGTTEHARRHAAAGVDLIVAQGTEAGGHTGQVSTMVLVPEVVDAVAPVPVLAAGGIARGRQIAAALAAGRRGCVVRFGVADHRGSRNVARRQGQIPGRQLIGHRAIPIVDRQARAHAAHRLDR